MSNESVRALSRVARDAFTTVSLQVSDDAMAEGWDRLAGLLMKSPDYEAMMSAFYKSVVPELTFDETKLRLLCGVFWQAFRCLPMGPYEHIGWLDAYDNDLSCGQHVSEFVGRRIAEGWAPLHLLSDAELDLLLTQVAAQKAERARNLKITVDDLPDAMEKAAVGDVIWAIHERFEEAEMGKIAENLRATLEDRDWNEREAA